MTSGSEPQPDGVAPDSGISHQPAATPQNVGGPTGQPSQPQPAWARPAAQVQMRHTDELEYHQLLRGTTRYRWWKPLLALGLGVLYFFTFSFAFSLVAFPIYMLLSGGSMVEISVEELVELDTQNPASLLIALLSIVLMIPSAMLAMLSVGLGSPKRLWSVALRIRWRWIGRTALPALVALVIMNVVGIAVSLLIEPGLVETPPEAEAAPYEVSLALWSLLIVLVLVPLQATAEELVFRGALMQSIGAWFGAASSRTRIGRALRSPWIPILLPSVGFALMHIYDIWGLLAVGVMGVVCAWLTWRTGGLEAAISIHVVNNLVVFILMIMAVGGETAQTTDGGGPGSLIGSVVGLVLFAWWVDRDFRRRDGRRTRIDIVEVRGGAIERQGEVAAA